MISFTKSNALKRMRLSSFYQSGNTDKVRMDGRIVGTTVNFDASESVTLGVVISQPLNPTLEI